jgi:maltose O-acetyltransferase
VTDLSAERAATGTEAGKRGESKLRRYLRLQRLVLHLRLGAAQAIQRCIPYSLFGNVRSAIYRACGFRHIARKVYIAGPLELRGDGDIYSRLHIGAHTFINTPCFIDLNAPVHIGEHVGIGHHVVIITSNHEIGPPHHRMGAITPAPVTIGDGAWIAAGAMILPGVTIGPGALVMAGAVVTKDVLANAKVAGARAQVVGELAAE